MASTEQLMTLQAQEKGRFPLRYHTMTAEMILQAGQKARSLGHSYVGSIHLLLAMAQEPGNTGQLLRMAGVDPGLTESMAQLQYGAGTPDLPLPQGLTREAKSILREAAREAKRQGCREILPIHLLLAMARREQTPVKF